VTSFDNFVICDFELLRLTGWLDFLTVISDTDAKNIRFVLLLLPFYAVPTHLLQFNNRPTSSYQQKSITLQKILGQHINSFRYNIIQLDIY